MKFAGKLWPSSIEAVSYLFASVVILLIANLSFLATVFNFTEDKAFISSESAKLFGLGLTTIDNFSLTPYAATLFVWFIVGVVLISVGRAFLNVYMEIKEDIEISTSPWHPSNYTNKKFWSTVALDFGLLIIGFGLVGMSFYSTAFFFLPFSLVLARVYLLDLSNLANLPYCLMGLILLFLAINICVICVKAIFYRGWLIRAVIK